MVRIWIMDKSNITFANKEFAFTATFDGETLKRISSATKLLPPRKQDCTDLGKQGTELIAKFRNAVYANQAVKAWKQDGHDVRVYQSGAGWYVGAYCDDGPYCRLSDYADDEATALSWLYRGAKNQHEPEEENTGEIKEIHINFIPLKGRWMTSHTFKTLTAENKNKIFILDGDIVDKNVGNEKYKSCKTDSKPSTFKREEEIKHVNDSEIVSYIMQNYDDTIEFCDDPRAYRAGRERNANILKIVAAFKQAAGMA